jgi:3-dehydroquinate dehydratase-1
MKFYNCVALQVKTGDLRENEANIRTALENKPDLIELRFDYIDNIEAITPDLLEHLLGLIQPKIPAIFTFRDSSEGGQMEIPEEERLIVLKTLINAQPRYLDIEMITPYEVLSEIINLAVHNNVILIFSYHNFEQTFPYEKSVEMVEAFLNKLCCNVDSKIVEESVYKIIFTANSFEDNLVPIKLCKTYSQKGYRIISFCMEEPGIFSRVACVMAGAFFTYASLEEITAPGQISLEEMKEFQQMLFD